VDVNGVCKSGRTPLLYVSFMLSRPFENGSAQKWERMLTLNPISCRSVRAMWM
jgi:hypothetical protein